MTERHNNKIFLGIFIRRHVEFLGGATHLLVTMMNLPRGGTKMQQPYTKVIRDTWHETAWESCWYQAYCVFSKLTLTDIMDYGYSLFTDTWIRRISDITFQIKVNTHFAFSGLDTVHRAECYIEWWLNLYVSSFVHPLIQYPYSSHKSVILLFNLHWAHLSKLTVIIYNLKEKKHWHDTWGCQTTYSQCYKSFISWQNLIGKWTFYNHRRTYAC